MRTAHGRSKLALIFAGLAMVFLVALGWITLKRSFEGARTVAEVVSWLVIIATGPAVFLQLRQHSQDLAESARKERIEVGEKSYLEIDQRFTDLLKLCIDRPRLDCYSLPRADPCDPPLTKDEQMQQKIL